ncbi:MAG: SAM-dependent methyltransferase [Candidatus Epulonipiscioides saccharophilum]|nr:MAG: SAM-dependent methyltransferase [Epulopiscium sp. AS2M-Bin001]
MLKQMLEYSKFLIKEAVKPGDKVIDATCGNGYDTLFLAEIVGPEGKVYGFDIQKNAIIATKALLDQHKITNVELIEDSHEKAHKYIDHALSAVVFNLGYLPKGDHNITTQPSSTIMAIHNILPYLKKHGLVVITIYHGHMNGKAEKMALQNYCQMLEQKKFSVLEYKFINQQNDAPFIIAIEKLS